MRHEGVNMEFSDEAGECSEIILRSVRHTDDVVLAKEMIAEYVQALGVDLSFQNIDEELAHFEAHYSLQNQGMFLLAFVDEQLAGCAGLRPLNSTDYINACELKRLYVRPIFRGLGIGLELTESLIEYAKASAYAVLLLDTLDEQETARELYRSLNFEEIPPFYYNPLPGAHYLKVDLNI